MFLTLQPHAPWLIAGAVLVLALVTYVVVRAERGKRLAQRDAIRSLGFVPAPPTPELARRLTQLYADAGEKELEEKYKVENVFSRRTGDGEMFIFDLVEKGSEHGYTEKQAVAIASQRLRLPPFLVLPRTGGDGVFARLADRAIAWAAKKAGDPVEFPQHPEFERNYLVRSPDADATRRFLDGNRLSRLAEMRHLGIRAGGDVFSLTIFEAGGERSTTEQLRERVDRASRVFSILAG